MAKATGFRLKDKHTNKLKLSQNICSGSEFLQKGLDISNKTQNLLFLQLPYSLRTHYEKVGIDQFTNDHFSVSNKNTYLQYNFSHGHK